MQSSYVAELFAPFYGVSTDAIATEATVLGLQNRFTGVLTLTHDFTLNAATGSGLYLYFAYPTELGLCQFFDVDSQFIGGWDGAQDNPYELQGPITLNVTTPSGLVMPFYVYRTDYPELGNTHWQTSLLP